jgi:hypothetical protein
MDLTNMNNPHINYASAFYCYHGPGLVDDTLKIFLSNGIDEVLIDQIGGPQNELMYYSYKSVPVVGLIPVTSTMQLSVYISDFTPNINVTEAAFDHFSVTDFSTNELPEIDSKSYRIYPNPSSEYFIIEGITSEVNFQLFTAEGTLLLDSYLSEKNNQLDISTFPKGLYVMAIGNQILKVMKY